MKLEKPSVMKWLIMKQRKDSWKSGRFRFQRYAVRIITKFLFKTFIYHRIERTNINKKRGREWPIKNKKNNRDKSKTISKQIWTKVGFGDINVACSSNKVDNNKSLSLSLFKSQITASYLHKHPTSHDLTLTAILIDTLPTYLSCTESFRFSHLHLSFLQFAKGTHNEEIALPGSCNLHDTLISHFSLTIITHNLEPLFLSNV